VNKVIVIYVNILAQIKMIHTQAVTYSEWTP